MRRCALLVVTGVAVLPSASGEGLFRGTQQIPWDKLTRHDAPSLTKSDWSRLTPAEGKHVKPEVFAHIDADSLAKLWDCSFFSAEQFLALPETSLGHMNRGCKRTMPHLIRWMTPSQVVALNSPSQRGKPLDWTREMCRELSPAQVAALGPGCSSFGAACVSGLQPSVWGQMSSTCVAGLRAETLPHVGDKLPLVDGLALAEGFAEPERVVAVGPKFCKAIHSKDTPANMRPGACSAFTAACASLLSPAIAKEFPANCVGSFSPGAMSGLSPELVSQLTEDGFAKLSAPQVAALNPRSCAALRPQHIAALSDQACGGMTDACHARLTHGAKRKLSPTCAQLRTSAALRTQGRVVSLLDAAGPESKASSSSWSISPIWALVPVAAAIGVALGRRANAAEQAAAVEETNDCAYQRLL